MDKSTIIKTLREMAKHPTVTLPRDCEALKAAAELIEQAQKQEPVGFMCQGCFYELDDVDEYCNREHVYLYTHPSPPQRQPLTDEEIAKCYETTGHYQTLRPQDRFAVFALARAIEVAHGIKGEA